MKVLEDIGAINLTETNMAINKTRYVNTKFWNDNYVSELDPLQKFLFIYFLTNEHTNISGIYEIPLKVVAMETGIEKSMIEKMLPSLSEKLSYTDGRIVIKNFLKHQETKSENTFKGILNCWDAVGVDVIKNLVEKGLYDVNVGGLQGAIKDHTYASKYLYLYLDSNLDLDSSIQPLPIEEKDTNPYSEDFEIFWTLYPEKKGKGKAFEFWKKISKKEKDDCIDKIKLQIESNHFKGRDGKEFIPNPATWLNQRRWEDEIKLKKDAWK